MRDFINADMGQAMMDSGATTRFLEDVVIESARLKISCVKVTDKEYSFKATTKEDGRYVGEVELQVTRKHFGKVGELSYEVLPAYRGQRFATEILRAIVQYCYKDLDMVNLYGKAPTQNIAAQYVLQRVGFALNEIEEEFVRFMAWNPSFQTA